MINPWVGMHIKSIPILTGSKPGPIYKITMLHDPISVVRGSSKYPMHLNLIGVIINVETNESEELIRSRFCGGS